MYGRPSYVTAEMLAKLSWLLLIQHLHTGPGTPHIRSQSPSKSIQSLERLLHAKVPRVYWSGFASGPPMLAPKLVFDAVPKTGAACGPRQVRWGVVYG